LNLTRTDRVGLAFSVAVFVCGAWLFWWESQYFPGVREHASLLQLVGWVGVVFVVGSVIGLFLGGVGAAVARILTRPYRRPLTVGYFLGLNLTALVLLWLFPWSI
jgi:hypothetical protein